MLHFEANITFQEGCLLPTLLPPMDQRRHFLVPCLKQVRYDDKMPQTECQPAHCPTREKSCTHGSSRPRPVPPGTYFYDLPRTESFTTVGSRQRKAKEGSLDPRPTRHHLE